VDSIASASRMLVEIILSVPGCCDW
jgi:hypothetical protein